MQRLKKVYVDLGNRSYNVWIKENILKEASGIIRASVSGNQCVIISQKNIFDLYGKSLTTTLETSGFSIKKVLVPDGEKAKSFRVSEKILRQLAKWGMNRKGFLIALGGGVVGDLVGYVAACYMRGIDFIQIPTTLLSQVDSSVGGKVAINIPEGKNMVGYFYQPKCVLIDPLVLKSLPDREIRNGLSEVIKYALIRDHSLFKYLSAHSKYFNSYHAESWIHVIYKSVLNKAQIVKTDETEKGLRAILNFGHTFGHAIEKTWGYKYYSHGEAVALGMRMAMMYSLKKHWLSLKNFEQMNSLLSSYKLDYDYPKTRKLEIFKNLFFDKKKTDKGITFIMIHGIGRVVEYLCQDEHEMKNFVINEMR